MTNSLYENNVNSLYSNSSLLIRLHRPCQAEEFVLLQNLLICFKIFQASQAEEFDLLQNLLICFKIFQASQARNLICFGRQSMGYFWGLAN